MLYHVISHNQAIQMNISHRISSHHNMLNQSHLITQLPQVCRERIHPRRAHPLSWLPWLPEAERGRSLVHQCDCKLIHFRRMILNEFLQYPPKISEDSEDFPSIFRNPMPWPTGCPWCPWHCPSLSSKPPLLLDLFWAILNWKPRSTSPGKEDLKNTCPSINDNKSIINKYQHYH